MHICQHAEVSERFNSYLLDLRNHGDSFHHPEMSLEDMGKDILDFIEKVDGLYDKGDLYFVVHSMGGRAMMKLLEKYPRINSVIRSLMIIDVVPSTYKFNQNILQSHEKVMQLSQIQLEKIRNSEELLDLFNSILQSKGAAADMMKNVREL